MAVLIYCRNQRESIISSSVNLPQQNKTPWVFCWLSKSIQMDITSTGETPFLIHVESKKDKKCLCMVLCGNVFLGIESKATSSK